MARCWWRRRHTHQANRTSGASGASGKVTASSRHTSGTDTSTNSWSSFFFRSPAICRSQARLESRQVNPKTLRFLPRQRLRRQQFHDALHHVAELSAKIRVLAAGKTGANNETIPLARDFLPAGPRS